VTDLAIVWNNDTGQATVTDAALAAFPEILTQGSAGTTTPPS
jgi:hypothetical protein